MDPAENSTLRTSALLAGAIVLHFSSFIFLPPLLAPFPFAAKALPILLSALGFAAAIGSVALDAHRSRSAFRNAKRANERLVLALEDLHRLGGLVKRCGWCDRVSIANGTWVDLTLRVVSLDDLEISHGICPDCEQLAFPELETELGIGRGSPG